MVELAVGITALVLSLCSLVVAILLFLHREDTHAIESKQRTLELELADVVDRLSVWQRRDAARGRKVAGPPADELGGSEPVQHQLGLVPSGKDALRATARARGLMR
jgi:hypothetical protein